MRKFKKLQKELKTKEDVVILTEDDILDADCNGEMDIRNDILNETLPEGAEWADVNISYSVKKPLMLKGRIFRNGEDTYEVYPNRYCPLEMLMYKNGLFVKTVPASVDWEVTSKNVDVNPVYREVWSERSLAGPGEPIGEEFDLKAWAPNTHEFIRGIQALSFCFFLST